MARNYDVFLGSLTTPLSISARVERFDGGSGAVTITNGIAFRPGDLTTAMLTAKQLRVFVSGIEQAIYVEALNGRHPDSSVKVALIQFASSLGSTPLSAEIRLGEVRGTTDIVKQTINSAPGALLFPTNPLYISATNLLWHHLTPNSNRPTGTFWDGWEARCRSTSPFTSEGWKPIFDFAVANPPTAIQLWAPTFDPALRPHWEFYAMTGEGFFLWRGIQWVNYFLTDFATPNNWGIGEQFMCGLFDATMHYWMTGNTASRDAPLTAYTFDPRMFNISAAQMADRTYTNNHGRIHFNKLMSLVLCHHLNLATVSWEPSASSNAAKARLLVDSAKTQQFADGHNTWPDQFGHQQNWQVFMRDTAIIAYYEWVSQDSDILQHVVDGYNYINNNWWVTTPQRAWTLEDAAGSTIGAELNGFGLEVAAWLYRRTGTTSYKTRGDEALNGLVNDGFWGGAGSNPKFPNECLWGTMSYIASRQGVA